MKKLFKCEYTGEVFDNELDCIESEYKNGNECQKFVDLTNSFIEEAEKRFGILVIKETIDIYDEKVNYIQDRIVHWRHVVFKFILNGKEYKYSRYSDPIGDGRWNWKIKDTVESFIDDFETEFILPSIKIFSGILEHHFPDEYNQKPFWKLDHKKLNDILGVLDGKKIKIEIID